MKNSRAIYSRADEIGGEDRIEVTGPTYIND